MTHFTRFDAALRAMTVCLALAPAVVAQEQHPGATAAPIDRESASFPRPEAEKPGLGQLQRDFGHPGAIRAWERGMYLNPRHRSRYSYPSVYGSYFDGYSGAYGPYYSHYDHRRGDNRVYRESYAPNYENYSLRLDHAYDLGVAPSEIEEHIAAQAGRALTDYRDAMQAGYDAFRRASYGHAARYFLLASQLNHGDPSSRLCAAHAQTALGQYSSAAGLVHRALDLQPKLVYLPLDIRDSYARISDFENHLAGLREAAEGSWNANLWFLLGYYHYNSGGHDLAAAALARAHQLSPHDRVIARFAEAVPGAR